ncbi:MAG: 3'-5' exonuclease [Undibacterium sp.]|uniref:3'-5' exonuclease n=1 Tax=Undibacterium sp. TaxID=1914977 RepID=UPI00271A077C|nr:3'-5' exonuclease [Undibacterium sp.]MDO8652591.1 3'-5' exonuclease [Undibacterium sp.]
MTTDDEIHLPPELPAYPGIRFNDICLVRSPADAERAYTALTSADVLGFDTESKPVFFKGQQSDGPHLIQLATDTQVFLFPILQIINTEAVKEVLESRHILKVGFGLGDDNKRLHAKLSIKLENVLDLSRAMRESRHRDMGAKAAVAKFFGMKLQKSKKTSTSNWANVALSERQMQYAADDAQVALLVYRKWLGLKSSKG